MEFTSNAFVDNQAGAELCGEGGKQAIIILLASMPLTFREGLAYISTCVWHKCHTNITSLSILVIISRKDRDIERDRENDNLFIESDRLVYEQINIDRCLMEIMRKCVL